MRKTIKLNENQLNVLIDNIISEDGNVPRAYAEHWENKFEKSTEILLKIGYDPNELINKINIIINKHQI